MILQAMNEIKTNAQEMNNKMDGMSKNMDAHTKTLQEEMQCMGAGLQDGLDEVEEGQNQLKGEMEKNTRAVEQLKEEQGKVIRETCWARVVTEKATVTVTQWEKVNGVTETCTREIRHVESAEIMVETRHEVTTEIKCTETREIEGELDGVKETEDEHTHTEVVEDNGGRARRAC